MGDGLDSAPRAVGEIDLTDAAGAEAVHERLARVERLLDADLSSLGPSVVTASIGELLTRLDDLGARIGAVEAAVGAPAPPASLALVEERLGLLDRRLDRLTRLVEAATEPLAEDAPPDPALARIEDAIVGLTIVVQQLGVAASGAADRRS